LRSRARSFTDTGEDARRPPPAARRPPVLVDAIIAMARSLDLGVVAEGIETRGQRTYLQSSGCTEGQGFYFGRPVDGAVFEALLQEPAGVRAR